MSRSAADRLLEALSATCKSRQLDFQVQVKVEGDAGANTGFGTGTAIRLACLEGFLSHANKYEPESELIALSGRGRTSGVGIQTYFHGGLALDCGTASREDMDLLPSSNTEFERPVARPLARLDLPPWPLATFLIDAPKIEGNEERSFFQSNAHIPKSDIDELCYELFFSMPGSVLDRDLAGFSRSLNNIQRIGFKAREWDRLGASAKEYSDWLFNNGAKAVALSSLGPIVLAVFDETAVARAVVADFCKAGNIAHLVTPRNLGRRLQVWK